LLSTQLQLSFKTLRPKQKNQNQAQEVALMKKSLTQIMMTMTLKSEVVWPKVKVKKKQVMIKTSLTKTRISVVISEPLRAKNLILS
jgi:hypothetical protein